MQNKPNIGDIICIGPSDDRTGGRATISKVYEGISAGKPATFIEVNECPGSSFNWEQYLCGEQDNLRNGYGERVVFEDRLFEYLGCLTKLQKESLIKDWNKELTDE